MPILEFSLETTAVKTYMDASGVPYKVTSTTGGVHAPTSYHYQKLALDLAGLVPTRDSPALMAVFNALVPVESELAELIYARAPYNVKNGRHVPLYASAIHHDHVHVAVHRGTFIRWPGQPANLPIMGGPDVVKPQFDPPLARFVSWLNAPNGGGWGLSADGNLYALGGAPYRLFSDGQAMSAFGKDYFQGRTAAKLERLGDGYTIVATSGERYDYP